MKLTRPMLWGSILGALAGVAATVLSIFQYDSEAISLGQVIGIGLAFGVPVTTVGGALAGWIWGKVLPERGATKAEAPATSARTAVGSRPNDRTGGRR